MTVRIAREALYTSRAEGLSSFRQFPQEYLRFFDETTGRSGTGRKSYQIKPAVTKYTRFELYNLMSPLLPLRDPDVIFCRNVLIYMDGESQKKIVRSLHQALPIGGCLFLSLVDSMTVPGLFHENRQNRCVIHEKR